MWGASTIRGLRPILILAVAAVSESGCGREADAERALLVSAAASLSEAIRSVADGFEDEHGVRVRLNVGGSQMLAAQIIEGAPVDVFISADVRQLERAAAAGRIDADQRVDLLSNQLVIVVPSDRAGAVTGPHDLARPEAGRIALGDPEAAPAGVYARRYLRGLGLWEALAPRVVPTRSVRAALRAVESGTVDAGIVYRTDVRTSSAAVVAFAVPVEDGPTIVYPAAVARGAPNPVDAQRFVAYLQGAAARRRFEAAGFRMRSPTAAPAAAGAAP